MTATLAQRKLSALAVQPWFPYSSGTQLQIQITLYHAPTTMHVQAALLLCWHVRTLPTKPGWMLSRWAYTQ